MMENNLNRDINDFNDQFECELQEIKSIYNTIQGREAADLLIKNIQILDVYGETIFPGSLLVKNGKIIALNPDETIEVKEVLDGKGMYAIPGLIDAHFHFESQLVKPSALAEVMVPCGTTTCVVETLDLISAAGDEGVKAAEGLFRDYEKLPYRIYAFAPGKKVDFEIAKQVLDMKPVIGLGEFDHFSYSKGNEDDLKKAAYAKTLGKMMNGHWGITTLTPMELNFLPAIGASNNHDVWNAEDLEKSMRIGFPTHIKFGVGNVKPLLNAILNRHFPTENIMLCTDNLSVNHMKTKGHMDFIISEAISMGFDPIKTIKMATYNAAKHFKIEDKVGSLTPGKYADIVLTDSLSKINPVYVFKDGELVASKGQLLKNVDIDYSDMVKEGEIGLENLSIEELDVKPLELSEDGKKAKVLIFDLFGRGHAKFYKEEWLPVVNGEIVPELEGERLSRISVIQRYTKDNNRNVVNGYFKGININKGTVSTSFSAPSSYIIVIGNNSEEMCDAVKELDKYSGACLVTEEKQIMAVLPITIYGMMTNLSAQELLDKSEAIDKAVEALGHKNIGEPVVNKLLSLFISLHRFNFMK
jgi:adenine deaminase